MSTDSKPTEPKPIDKSLSFEESLTKVEQVVRSLEEGQLGLGPSIEAYEQAVSHLKYCYGLLAAAERRVELLTAVSPEGEALTAPFDDVATQAASEAAPARRKRAIKKGSTGGDASGDAAADLLSGLD